MGPQSALGGDASCRRALREIAYEVEIEAGPVKKVSPAGSEVWTCRRQAAPGGDEPVEGTYDH
jgi:hypothetical protein